MGEHVTQGMLAPEENNRVALLKRTLDLLILRILVFGPEHGQGIARAIQLNSEDVLLVDHGALYPALQRLEAQEMGRWRKLAAAIARILDLGVCREEIPQGGKRSNKTANKCLEIGGCAGRMQSWPSASAPTA